VSACVAEALAEKAPGESFDGVLAEWRQRVREPTQGETAGAERALTGSDSTSP